ncbi:CYFA0S05e01046g1_1 [Cyberlindnera fabianii]|uniref:CYFA0S05e01046g1_1 n=1 Tax=Cyberlindnera fabianii TaxID=36022 RepID=A0A061ATL9_CYBFA|nr:Protein bir1 [Cyberlindnera fabianii]CDR40487.1 CYFA0S05e01046g1_1 [Cyberlindnera fabianii]
MPPKKNPKNRLKLLEKQFFLFGAAGREATFDYEMADAELQIWPYSTPSAKLMANQGFCFVPTKKLTDRVYCVGCRELQHNWEGVENPAEYHLKKHPHCPISLVHYYNTKRENGPIDWPTVEILGNPLSSESMEVRRATFAKHWPFDNIPDAKPTTEKMVEAGFCYFPHDQGDDLASCMYCGTSLEGWEEQDDPMEEHSKRAKGRGCYYLDMLAKNNERKRLSEELQGGSGLKKVKVDEPLGHAGDTESIEHATNQVSQEKKTNKRTKSKKARKMKEPIVEVPDDSLPDTVSKPLRPRRAASRAAEKMIQISEANESLNDNESGNDSDVELLSEESFGLTSNELQLNSEPEAYTRSSQRSNKSQNASKNVSKKGTNSAKLSSASPPKKSKILDSSFGESENDMFGPEKINGSKLDTLLSPKKSSKALSEKPMSSPAKSMPLRDITNVSDTSTIFSPKTSRKRPVIHNDDDDEEEEEEEEENPDDDGEILLVSNNSSSVSNSNVGSSIKETGLSNKTERAESSSTLKPSSAIEEQQDDMAQSPNIVPSESSISEAELSPLASKQHNSPSLKSEQSTSLSRVRTNSKSVLSHSRFFESPKMVRRSQSPFLDDNYQGSDKITASEAIIGPDDNPIEESTDHNIEVSLSDLNKHLAVNDKVEELSVHQSLEATGSEKPKILPLHESTHDSIVSSPKALSILSPTVASPEPQALTKIGDVPPLQSTSTNNTTNDDDSFHSAGESTPSDYWPPTDTNKLFHHLVDLETAQTYVSELTRLPYELHDDVDGRVTNFINQMPEEEVEMTIEEWIQHMAVQGKEHLRQVCTQMIEEFDEECERALDKLKALETID